MAHRFRFLRTATFGLVVSFAAVFALSAAMFVFIFNSTYWSHVEESTNTYLAHELALLKSDAGGLDVQSLKRVVDQRDQIDSSGQFQYLLVDKTGRRVAGDLAMSARRVGYSSISIAAPPGLKDFDDPRIILMTLGTRLPDGAMLVVGRDIYQLTELGEWIQKATVWVGSVAALLACVSGWLIGAMFLKRLAAVNEAASSIMSGDIGKRLPTIGMGSEFNEVSANLNRMLDRIQDLMDSLRQVSSDIAHDLRTPLSRLRNELSVLLSRGSTVEGYRTATHHAIEEADQILSTFDALLKIGQIEGGAPLRGFSPVNLSEVLKWVVQAYTPAAEDAGKSLTIDDLDETIISGDTQLLTQLFANLVNNAIVHTPPATRIRVALKQSLDVVVATVVDNGPGVPAHERLKVLKRFYRLDRSRSSAGAGLGLTLASAIADLHGAALELDDNRPGLAVSVAFARASTEPVPDANLRSQRASLAATR